MLIAGGTLVAPSTAAGCGQNVKEMIWQRRSAKCPSQRGQADCVFVEARGFSRFELFMPGSVSAAARLARIAWSRRRHSEGGPSEDSINA
jgi:hypothetical protein